MADPMLHHKDADPKSQALFEKLFEFSPDAIVVIDSEGKIARVNGQVETMFGYRREELLGQPIEVLLPERFRPIHPRHRKNYHANPRVRAMGAGLELYARRNDGSEFPVDIMLGPLEYEGSSQVLASFAILLSASEPRKHCSWKSPTPSSQTSMFARSTPLSQPACVR